MKRMARVSLFAALLAAVALGLPHEAQAYTWSKVTLDSAPNTGWYSSMAVDASGNLLISYKRQTDLRFAICDLSASTNQNCDQSTDWSLVTVDSDGEVGGWSSIAVDANGDPMISHWKNQTSDLRFAMCDRLASANGNCDQTTDWTLLTVESAGSVGGWPSIAVDANGDPMISYCDDTNDDLNFAICDRSVTGCDEQGDWTKVTVDAAGNVGFDTSIAVDANGDPVISHYDRTNDDLKFAICDLSATGCDEQGDWSTVTVDSAGSVGEHTSIAVDANGDPVISHYDTTNDDLKFAICDLSASANGNCDETTDWSLVTVDSAGSVGRETSITVDINGDPMISYYDETNGDLKFAICDLSASANGNCDEATDWSLETVDAVGVALDEFTSIAVGASGHPMISYQDWTNKDLKFATAAPPRAPVGGIAELPHIADSSGRNYIPLAVGAAAALGVLTAGAWYARRRWLG